MPPPPEAKTVDDMILDAWVKADGPDAADEWLKSRGEYHGEMPDDV